MATKQTYTEDSKKTTTKTNTTNVSMGGKTVSVKTNTVDVSKPKTSTTKASTAKTTNYSSNNNPRSTYTSTVNKPATTNTYQAQRQTQQSTGTAPRTNITSSGSNILKNIGNTLSKYLTTEGVNSLPDDSGYKKFSQQFDKNTGGSFITTDSMAMQKGREADNRISTEKLLSGQESKGTSLSSALESAVFGGVKLSQDEIDQIGGVVVDRSTGAQADTNYVNALSEKVNGDNERLTNAFDLLNDDYRNGRISSDEYVAQYEGLKKEWDGLVKNADKLKNYDYLTGKKYYDWLKQNGTEQEVKDFEAYVASYDDSYLESLANSYKQTLTDWLTSKIEPIEMISALASGDESYLTSDERISTRLREVSQELQSYTLNGRNDQGFRRYSLQTISSLMPMVNDAVIATITGGAFGLEGGALNKFVSAYTNVQMGMFSAGETMRQRLAEGNRVDTSFINGVTHGAITGMVEAFNVGGVTNIVGLLTGTVGQGILGVGLLSLPRFATMAMNTVQDGAGEMVEEWAEVLADYYADRIQNALLGNITGDKVKVGNSPWDPETYGGVGNGGLTDQMIMAGAGAVLMGVPTNVAITMDSLAKYKAGGEAIKFYEAQKQYAQSINDNESVAKADAIIDFINRERQSYLDRSTTKGAVETAEDQVAPAPSIDEVLNVTANAFKLDVDDQINNYNQLKQSAENLSAELQNSLNQRGFRGADGSPLSIDKYASWTPEQRTNAKQVVEYANSLNTNVGFDDTIDGDGYFNPKTGQVVINPNSQLGQVSTMIHEYTHLNESSKFYDGLKKVVEEIYDGDIKNAEKVITREYKKRGIDVSKGDLANREFVAIVAQSEIGNAEFVKKLIKYNSSLAYRMFKNIQAMATSDVKTQLENTFMQAFRDSVSSPREMATQRSEGLSEDELRNVTHKDTGNSDIDKLMDDLMSDLIGSMSAEEFDHYIKTGEFTYATQEEVEEDPEIQDEGLWVKDPEGDYIKIDDGYISDGKTVAWKDERIRELVRSVKDKSFTLPDKAYRHVYAMNLSPHEYIALSYIFEPRHNEVWQNDINQDLEYYNNRVFDPDKMSFRPTDSIGYMYFTADVDGINAKIVGQEGNHRSIILDESGYSKMPILLFTNSPLDNSVVLKGMNALGRTPDEIRNPNKKLITRDDYMRVADYNLDDLIQKFGSGAKADIQYSKSLTPEELKISNEYNEAVADDNMEKAQELVRDYAKQYAEATGQIVVEGFHGTNARFNRFLKKKLGSKNFLAESAYMGFFMAGSKETAENYTGINDGDFFKLWNNPEANERRIKVREKYNIDELEAQDNASHEQLIKDAWEKELASGSRYADIMNNIQNPELTKGLEDMLDTMKETIYRQWYGENIDRLDEEFETSEGHKKFKEVTSVASEELNREYEDLLGYDPNIKHLFGFMSNPLVHDFNREGRDVDFSKLLKQARKDGNDGAIFKNVQDGGDFDTIYVVFEPNQFKSADPVTYDNKGKVIPLEKRFNQKTSDLRYSKSLTPEQLKTDADYTKAVEEGNTKKAKRLVEETARKNGYTVDVFHGTYDFGKTKFTDYGGALFLTDDPSVARNFSGDQPVRDIAGSFDANKGDLEDVVNYVKQNTWADNIREAKLSDFDQELERVKPDKADIKKYGQEFYDRWAKNYEIAKNNKERFLKGEPFFYMRSNSFAYDYPNDPIISEERVREFAEENNFKNTKNGGLNGGVYQMYLRPENMLEIEVGGNYYTDVPIPEELREYARPDELKNGYATSDQILRMAIDAGYDTIKYANMREGGDWGNAGVSNVYVSMDAPRNVKSADTVVYDDEGNVIPLSERFNPENEDIRYSESLTPEDLKNGTIYNKEEINELERIQDPSGALSEEDLALFKSRDKDFIKRVRDSITTLFRRRYDTNSSGNNDSERIITVSGDDFYEFFKANKNYLKNPETVDLHKKADYQNGTAYMSNDGLSGFYISEKGDLQSVYNNSGKPGFPLDIADIVKEKADSLDCFESDVNRLAEMYQETFGFKVASILDYNREVMEKDHGKEYTDAFIKKYGEAPVYFLVKTDADVETKHFEKTQWPEAFDYRNSYINKESNERDPDDLNIDEKDLKNYKTISSYNDRQHRTKDVDTKTGVVKPAGIIDLETTIGKTTHEEEIRDAEEFAGTVAQRLDAGQDVKKAIRRLKDNPLKNGVVRAYYVAQVLSDRGMYDEMYDLAQWARDVENYGGKLIESTKILYDLKSNFSRAVYLAKAEQNLVDEYSKYNRKTNVEEIIHDVFKKYGEDVINSKSVREFRAGLSHITREIRRLMPKTLFDRLKQFRLWAMLSGAKSPIGNFISNSATLGLYKLNGVNQAILESALKDVTIKNVDGNKTYKINQEDRNATFGKNKETSKYNRKIAEQEWQTLKKEIKSKYDLGTEDIPEIIKNNLKIDRKNKLQKSIDMVADVAQGIQNALLNDAPFARVAFLSKFDELAQARGIDLKTIDKNSKTYNKLVEDAYKYAEEVVSHDETAISRTLANITRNSASNVKVDPDSYLKFLDEGIKWVKEKANKGEVAYKLIDNTLKKTQEWFAPFFKTNASLLKKSLQYSPLELAQVINDYSKVKAGQMDLTEMVDHMAKFVTGSELYLLGMLFSRLGWLKWDKDDEDYSGRLAIKVPNTKYGYTIDFVDPVSTIFAKGVVLDQELSEEGVPFEKARKLWEDYETIFLSDELDMFSSLNDFIQTIKKVDKGEDQYGEYTLGDGATDTAFSVLNSYIPAIVRDVSRLIDPNKKVVYDNRNWKYLANRLMNSTPLRGKLVDKKDATGNTLTYTQPFTGNEPADRVLTMFSKGKLVDMEGKAVSGVKDTGNLGKEATQFTQMAQDFQFKDENGDGFSDAHWIRDSVPSNIYPAGEKTELNPEEKEKYGKTWTDTWTAGANYLLKNDEYKKLDYENQADIIYELQGFAREVIEADYCKDHKLEMTTAQQKASAIKDFVTKNGKVNGELLGLIALGNAKENKLANGGQRYVMGEQDEEGKTIKNSRQLAMRKLYEENGVYEDILKAIANSNGLLEYADFGLGKTVVGYSEETAKDKYLEIYGSVMDKATGRSTGKKGKTSKGKSSKKSSTTYRGKTGGGRTSLKTSSLPKSNAKLGNLNTTKIANSYLKAYANVFNRSGKKSVSSGGSQATCPNCGARVSSNATRCPNCGAKL